MVLQAQTMPLPSGPLNADAGPFLGLGLRYAQSIGVKFFDNSYYASPPPVALWK